MSGRRSLYKFIHTSLLAEWIAPSLRTVACAELFAEISNLDVNVEKTVISMCDWLIEKVADKTATSNHIEVLLEILQAYRRTIILLIYGSMLYVIIVTDARNVVGQRFYISSGTWQSNCSHSGVSTAQRVSDVAREILLDDFNMVCC